MTDPSNPAAVRQLCLQLRPILGAKVERIYDAYLAEDQEGRAQIQRYLELLAGRHIPHRLGQNDTVLIPPSPTQAQGPYPVGTVLYAGKPLYEFGLRENEWIQHVAVLGRSGAGKTNVGFLLLRELNRKEKPFLVFDWKRNYRDLLALPEFRGMEVYTIGRDLAPLTFNPLIPPAGTNPRTWLKKLNEVIAHSYCLGNGVLFLLQQAVDAVYDDAGVYDGTVQKWPTFKDVLLKARNMDSRGREAGWLSSTLRALSSLCFGDMDRLLNTDNNKSLDRILETCTVLELDALTQSDKVFFVQALLLWIHHKRMTEERRESFKHAIFIEEAHHILSDERRSLVGGQSVMEIVFREIREFGESLVLLDQHPSKISLPALGNTYTTICLGLKHKTDVNAMGQCLLLDRERELLGMLEVGQAVVKLQGRIARPFQILAPEFPIVKGTITDGSVRDHMAGVTVTGGGQAPADENPQQLAGADRLGHTCTQTELDFLTDVLTYPDSGVAARYQRLGLSVRQGQKTKERLFAKKLIHDETKKTHTGRTTFLHLTDRGNKLLQDADVKHGDL